MLLDTVIAYAILKALGEEEWKKWTECPRGFVGRLESEYTSVKEVVVNTDDKKVIIRASNNLSSSTICDLHKLLGTTKVKYVDEYLEMIYHWA